MKCEDCGDRTLIGVYDPPSKASSQVVVVHTHRVVAIGPIETIALPSMFRLVAMPSKHVQPDTLRLRCAECRSSIAMLVAVYCFVLGACKSSRDWERRNWTLMVEVLFA